MFGRFQGYSVSTRIATNRNDHTVDLIVVSVKRAQSALVQLLASQVTSAMMWVFPYPYHLI
jgi:hypothetical protein